MKTVDEFLKEWKIYGDDKEFGAELRLFVSDAFAAGNAQGRIALREIKLWCLTTKEPTPRALAHIVRLCINAGVTESLPELEREQ